MIALKDKKLNGLQRGILKISGVNQYVDTRINESLPIITKENRNYIEYFQMLENKAWYNGTASELERFYKTKQPMVQYLPNSFWRVVNTNMVRSHSGFPRTISNAFGALLFDKMPEIKVESGSKARAQRLQAQLNRILDVNDILNLLQESAQLQSYSGMVGLKLNIDTTVDDVPFITLYPKEDFKVYRKYGQIIYIDFYDYYDDKTLVSRYGRGYISYSLFDDRENELELSSVAELANLKDIAFYHDGEPVNTIFATPVQNKSGDRSDYDGLMSLFNSLDEVISTKENYIRTTKPIETMTEDLAPKNESGNVLARSHFDTSVVVLDSPLTESGTGTKYERTIPDIKMEGFKSAIEQIQEQILMAVSLSPGTLGLSTGGSRESSEALEIRERASARVRNEKLSIWKEKLADFLEATILMKEYMDNGHNIDGTIHLDKIPQFEIAIGFTDYATDTLADRVDLYIKQYEAGLVPLDFALAKIYGPDLPKNQLMNLIISAKKLNGLPLTAEENEFVETQNRKSVKSQESIYDLND